jgi:hypothetical protein
MFEAVLIERAFARLFGDRMDERRDIYDADVFRGGDPKALGRLVQLAARWLMERLDTIPFTPEECLRAGARTRLDLGIECLDRHGAEMREVMPTNREDIRWSVIGDLVAIIVALLDHMDGKGGGEAPAP